MQLSRVSEGNWEHLFPALVAVQPLKRAHRDFTASLFANYNKCAGICLDAAAAGDYEANKPTPEGQAEPELPSHRARRRHSRDVWPQSYWSRSDSRPCLLLIGKSANIFPFGAFMNHLLKVLLLNVHCVNAHPSTRRNHSSVRFSRKSEIIKEVRGLCRARLLSPFSVDYQY